MWIGFCSLTFHGMCIQIFYTNSKLGNDWCSFPEAWHAYSMCWLLLPTLWCVLFRSSLAFFSVAWAFFSLLLGNMYIRLMEDYKQIHTHIYSRIQTPKNVKKTFVPVRRAKIDVQLRQEKQKFTEYNTLYMMVKSERANKKWRRIK